MVFHDVTNTGPRSEVDEPMQVVTSLLEYNKYLSHRSRNYAKNSRTTFDRFLMRCIGFLGVPARSGFSPAQLISLGFGPMALAFRWVYRL